MSHLVSYSQIEANLRRTASNGLISLLNQKQLEDLAFKYFSVKDEYGNIIGYQCPYSGKVYSNYEDIVLEHIVPVASKGGTVLFNCIPTSKEVNGSDQKGAKHLITWWINSKVWNEDAPSRLEKIVNYMLDGYNSVFEEYTMEEVESSYQDIEPNESILDEEDNIDLNKREENKLLKQAKNNGIHSYLGFILDCINTLDTYNINTTEIRNKLKSLEDKHIFEDIDRYQLYQNIVQKIIVSRIGDDSRSYLTYTLNIDINKLIDSINLDKEEDIYNEINKRLTNIENLLQENNLSTIEYFKSLRDIQDIDIIYKNDISEEEISIFLENIKIGIDTKIDIFIEMLKTGNKEILNQNKKETFIGHQNIKIGHFWHRNKNRETIIKILFEKLKENSDYDVARKIILNNLNVKTIEEYYINEENKHQNRQNLSDEEKKFQSNLELRITCFIQMLNEGNTEILKQRNKEIFTGYSNTKVGKFWMINKNRKIIITTLFDKLKDNPDYDVARKIILNNLDVKTIEEYYINEENKYQKRQNLSEEEKKFQSNLELRIECFIEMLKKGNIEILEQRNKEIFTGYPNTKVGQFWHRNKNREIIIKALFEKLKDNSDYDVAREFVLNNLGVKTIEEYYINEENKHQNRQNLSDEEKKFQTNLELRIRCFIEMLNEGNIKIFEQKNSETFTGYPNTKVGYFWHINKNREIIIKTLFDKLKDNSDYDVAREFVLNNLGVKTIEEYYINEENKHQNRQNLSDEEKKFQSNLELRIECFIEMINEGNVEIFKSINDEIFTGYPNTRVGKFWHQNKNREIIIKTLFDKLKDNLDYDLARRIVLNNLGVKTIEEYYMNEENKHQNRQNLSEEEKKFQSNLELRITCFIQMLNEGNTEILKQRNKESFEGYPNTPVGQFWRQNKNREIIIQTLFNKLKDNPSYDTARDLVLKSLKGVNTIEEYYEKLEKESKKMKENNKIKKQLEETIKMVDEIYGLLNNDEVQRKRA